MSTTDSGNELPHILSFTSFNNQPTSSGVSSGIPLSAEFCDAFADVTGWTLGFKESKPSRHRRGQPGLADSPVVGKLFINDMSAAVPANASACHRGKCDQLTEKLDALVAELQRTKLQLYAAHAELAVQTSLAPAADDQYRLAELLASLLNTAAQCAGCEQAAMYLLDDDAEWLTMRSSVGLDGKHIGNVQRHLATSIADIEAMAGHAIVITDPTQGATWNLPEEFPSAICVPIASATTILGTLWIFGRSVREYSDQEVNLVEIIAGRIAAELEREALLRRHGQKQAESTQASRIDCHPVIDPPFAGWVMEGQCGYGDKKFVDWDVTDAEEIRLSVGKIGSHDERIAASLFVDPLTASFQAHGRVEGVSFWMLDHETDELLEIDEWSNPQQLDLQKTIVAATTDDAQQAKRLVDNLEAGVSSDGIVLCLRRK